MASAQSINRKLQGKVAIVTGGASGIGEATARLFAAHGARGVVIADIQDEKGRSVAESIGSDRCSYFHCDVTDEEQVKAMVDWTAEHYGGLDVMFSNAGIIRAKNQTILDLDFSGFDDVLRVNARGMAASVTHAGRKMVELGSRGAIVCTASAVSLGNVLNNIPYVMSKHALVGLMQTAGPVLGAHGIRINCVSPTVVLTPLTAKIGITSPEEVERLQGPFMSLKGEELTAERVAEAVLFLASDEAAFISGRNLGVDGGIGVHIGFD